MIEPQCPNLKALDGDTQKPGAQEMPQAATWSQLQEELERIIPRFSSDSEALPAFTSNLIKRLKTAKWTAEENAVWDELRAEFEALRLRIRADACRSRKRLEGKGP